MYSAEIINTLTNLLFMYLASKGIHNCLTNDHDTVFLVAFIGGWLRRCPSMPALTCVLTFRLSACGNWKLPIPRNSQMCVSPCIP